MKPWKNLFRTHILERGLKYYEEDCVTSLKQRESSVNIWLQFCTR